MPKILKNARIVGSTSDPLHTSPHTHDAPPLTTAKVKLRLQAALYFHVYEPPLLLLRARSNSQDMSALASQPATHSTAQYAVLEIYQYGSRSVIRTVARL